MSDLATTGSTRHANGSSSSFKYSSNSKNQGGSEFTTLVLEPKAKGNEANTTSADFEIGIDMLSNSIDEHHQAETKQSDALLSQSTMEEVHGQAVTQNEESDGTKNDLFGGDMVSGIKSENNSVMISSEEQKTTSMEGAEGTIP